MTAIPYSYLAQLELAGFNQVQANALVVFTTHFVTDMTNTFEINLEKQLAHQIERSELAVENHIDRVKLQTDNLSHEIKLLEQKMDHRFAVIDQQFEVIKQRFEGVDRRFDVMEQRFDVMEQRFDVLEKGFISLTSFIKWSLGIMIALIPTFGAFLKLFFH